MIVEPHGDNQHAWEISVCKELIPRLIGNPKVVVEVGVLYAGSFKAWSDIASDDALLIGVDVNRADLPTRSSQIAKMIVGRSPDIRDKVVEALNGALVDYLFIDGDHAYTSVQADYEAFKSLVRPGGVIGFHDVCYEEVAMFWADLCSTGLNCITICANSNKPKMGIGLIA